MGLAQSVMNYFMGGDDGVEDPATGLTMRQKKLIYESWAFLGARKNQKRCGVALFIHLFESYPNQKEFFPLFKDKSLEELKVSSKMRAHAATLMSQVGAFVDNLDDTECFIGLLEKVANNHHNRAVGFKQFEELRGIFGSFLEQELGSQATPELKEAWDKLWIAFNTVVKETAKKDEA